MIFNKIIENQKDAVDDINGAFDSGMLGILVKTGKYRNGDEEKLKQKPLAIVDDFNSAVDFLMKNYPI
jgi:ribonucleotide monophosphatase NagD (HAD superfamily)